MRKNTRGKRGDAVTIRTAFLPSHFLCLTPANNHPPHTRLFNWAVYTQDASSAQVHKKLFFQFSWQDAEELVLRKLMFQPLPLLRNYRHLSRWHTWLQPPEEATPWDPSASLGNACQSCVKSTSLAVGKLQAVHYLAHGHQPVTISKPPSSEEGCPGNFCMTTAFWASPVLTHLKLSHSDALDEGILSRLRFPKTGIRPI